MSEVLVRKNKVKRKKVKEGEREGKRNKKRERKVLSIKILKDDFLLCKAVKFCGTCFC